MKVRIECNTARDLDIAIRLSDSVEFSRKMRRVYIENSTAEEFEQLCDFFTENRVECRAVVDECEAGESLPAGW